MRDISEIEGRDRGKETETEVKKDKTFSESKYHLCLISNGNICLFLCGTES